MAEHVFEQLIFHFRNGDEWTVEHDELADVWISRVTTSYGRIHGGQIQEIHPCKSFKVEILLSIKILKRWTWSLTRKTKSAFKSTSHSSKRIQAGLITSTRVASLQQTVIFIL